jgi:hypothetical protein
MQPITTLVVDLPRPHSNGIDFPPILFISFASQISLASYLNFMDIETTSSDMTTSMDKKNLDIDKQQESTNTETIQLDK